MPSQIESYSALLPAPNGDEGKGGAAETAIPIGRRERYAARETATIRRGSFVIPSSADELRHAERKWSEDSWQMRTLRALNSYPVQIFFVCLLLLDVLILFSELIIDVSFPSCKKIVRDAISCCPDDGGTDRPHFGNSVLSLLGGDGSHDHNICADPLVETDHQAGCDEHKYHGAHVAHSVLFWLTISILATFEIELLLLIYLLGPAKFFRQIFYVVDLVVVTTSLFLELWYKLQSGVESAPAGLLVFFRLWRFVRIGHGLVASTYEIEEHKMHLAMEHLEELEEKLKRYEDVPERPEKLRNSESSH